MDPAKMKVVDLRSELGALGLDTKGNKPALVERLRKALEAKSGEAISETTILDTSTEDIDDSPKTPVPAARVTRRSSSTKLVIPMSKVLTKPIEEPDTISEESNSLPATVPKPPTVDLDDDSSSQDCVETTQQSSGQEDMESADERREVQQDEESKESESQMETDPDASKDADSGLDKDSQSQDVAEVKQEEEEPQPELTEEEELELHAEKLKEEFEKRKEDTNKYIEARKRHLEGLKEYPIKYARVQRKRNKQARWQTLYNHVNGAYNINSEPLPESFSVNKPTPLMNLNINRPRGEPAATPKKVAEEPEQDEFKIALSYYDCDLNQHLELPELNSVLPNSEGTFAHAWAGTRATHGVTSGRVCYEVRVGSIVGTTEENVTNGLRIGWSTGDASLHLGEDKLGWGYENNGELVNDGEYKEYGKTFQEGDVVGVYLDLKSNPCKISYTLNGVEQGTAFEVDPSLVADKPVFPHIVTKNYCYKVNFGYDRYNMLTKTKSVRSKLAIPVSQLKEVRKSREAELIKQREEARERIEKIRKEREERQRKKREEREKLDRERKEKEAERKKAAEEAANDDDKDKQPADDQEMQSDDKDKQAEDDKYKQADDDKDKQSDDEKDKQADDDKDKQSEDEKDKQADDNNDKQLDDKEKQDDNKDMEMVEVEAKDSEPTKVEGETKLEPGKPKENGGDKLSASGEPMETDEGIKSERKTAEKVLEEEESRDPMTTLKIGDTIKDFAKDAMDEVLDGQEACLLPGYILIAHADLHLGPQRPKTLAECEVILMVGLPGSGKTYWVQQHIAKNPDKKYNVLCTGSLLNQMQVNCKPFRSTYEGNWENLLAKCSKYVLKLFAQGRKRNFILDQTNVYQSAQKRKLREFEGYKRIAVVVVPDKETYEERLKNRRESEAKDLSDDAITDMKANFALPEKGQHLEEVIYAELDEEEAKKVIEEYQKEGRTLLGSKDREKRERSPHRDGPPSKRSRNEERRSSSFRDERRPQRDFGSRDRSSGGESDFMDYRRGGGGGAGGSRWGQQRGGRDSGRWGGPPSRFDQPPRDRWSRGGNDNFGGGGGRDFNRDGGFRGGRGGMGGRGPGPVGGSGPGGMGGFGGPQGFDRSSRSLDKRPGMGDKRQANQGNMGGGMGGMGGGGGAGSWQRGSQMSQQQAAPGTQRPPGQRPGQGSALSRTNQNKGDNQNNQSNQNQNQQNAGWNQWGNWGNWGNWNQTPGGWGGWNWGNWGGQQPGGNNNNNAAGNTAANNTGASGTGGNKNAAATTSAGNAAQNTGDQSQWAAWYQWQQWQQQQQQQWSGMQGGNQSGNNQDQQQLWAQYYQNYGAANNAGAAAGNQSSDKK